MFNIEQDRSHGNRNYTNWREKSLCSGRLFIRGLATASNGSREPSVRRDEVRSRRNRFLLIVWRPVTPSQCACTLRT